MYVDLLKCLIWVGMRAILGSFVVMVTSLQESLWTILVSLSCSRHYSLFLSIQLRILSSIMSLKDEIAKSRKPTLLQKYDMLVDCLSFEHIEKCNNTKELENILKVLRSGEEGQYPHLEKAAEDKLRVLSPNNPLLRVNVPVILTSALPSQDRQFVSNEMQEWIQEMTSRENLLKSAESVNIDNTPAVRNSSVARAVIEKNTMNKSSSPQPKEKTHGKCAPNDYNFWDKFDADSEILKMDLEDERQSEKKALEKKQEELNQKRKEKENLEDKNGVRERLHKIVESIVAGDDLSLPEKEMFSNQEKQKGNECFRNHELSKALDHYTRSMAYRMNVDALNNRAITFLKLSDYPGALEDCNVVLKLDPSNVKAYFRRGVALFSCEKYQGALDDFEKALEMEPDDKNIQEYVQKARQKLGIPVSSKRVRMAIQTKTPEPSAEEEESNSDFNDKYYPFFNPNPNEDIALNAIGTAKVMCRCSGTPGFMKKVRSLEDIKDHGRICLRRNSRSQKIDVNSEQKSVDVSVENNQEEEFANGDHVNSQSGKMCKSNSSGLSVDTASRNDALTNLEKQKTPFSFSVFWSSIKNLNDLPSVAKALRALGPEQIAQVVGNKLEEKMLTLFILALRAHFSLPEEWGVVQKYLHSFSQLPRFSFVNMMLDKTTKKELELLLNDAEKLGLRVLDLLQLYGLTTCP